MENATEALMMAFAVLIFVLALSISISSFSLARQTTQSIVELTDREFDYTYVSTEYNENGKLVTSRTVSAETIIPTLYRAYKENYIVRFYDEYGNKLDVYQKKVNGSWTSVNEINLENEVIANQEKATLFINCLLNNTLEDKFTNLKNSENLSGDKFYDIIKKKTFKEELGIYYIEELEKEETTSTSNIDSTEISGDFTASETPEGDKTEKRVITYTMTSNN